MDAVYAPLDEGIRGKLRGGGFTLYGLLQESSDLLSSRYFWRNDLNKYDYIIVAHIWWQGDLLRWLLTRVSPKKIVILDGDDGQRIFPFNKSSLLRYGDLILPLSSISYFKREATGEAALYRLDFPSFFSGSLPRNIYPLHFSIPDEKISKIDQPRTKKFTQHIVDNELVDFLGKKGEKVSTKHCYFSEEDYYNDLRVSNFGVTKKRAGWDCLRHYELAANGCILCFRNLDQKPVHCAPLALNEKNSISYSSVEDLLKKIERLDEGQIDQLRINTFEWVKKQSTVERAKQFLGILRGI
jgi:hypothetical protein